MSDQTPKGDRQDPAEAKRLDTAVETSDQPADPQPEPSATEVSVNVEHSAEPVQELRTTSEPA